MIFISDVHYKLEHLASLPKDKGPIVILGDLINWIDYRDGQGIAMDVFGSENVRKLINLRKEHRFNERKSLWKELYQNDPDEISKKMQEAILKQYEDVFNVLKNYEVWFIPGNVDDVKIMNSYISNKVKNVDGLIIDYKNKKIGFAGGGVPTPINARGEIDEDTFSEKLYNLREVDIVCTHAPPMVKELVTDVITNKIEQGWVSLNKFIEEYQPQLSLFGDVHQPQASYWNIKSTKCINVGYFRATNQYLELSSIT